MNPGLEEYQALVARLGRGILACGLLGAAIALFGWGWREAAGVAAGAVGAFLNFRWLERAFARPGGASTGLFILRFGLLGVAGYVTMKVFVVSPVAFLAGLSVAVAAAILEVFYQLLYARRT